MKYRSGLEADIASQLRKNKIKFQYEPVKGKIRYTTPPVPHIYTPDFYITTKSGKTIIIECKGIWVYTDRFKHLMVRKQHPELDIRFVFSNPKTRIRKNSKTTYADICEGRGRKPFKGVKWKYAKGKIPQEWFDE